MQRILSCSLDGCIHMHEMDGLTYKEGKTFNLHQKGINSFVYSVKWKIIASCGEERFICVWCPITLSCLSYLRGHVTSVQDLAINDEKSHLISLGSDKHVKIWFLETYNCVFDISDNVKPEYQLSSLLFCNKQNTIILGSRKVNFWPFRT